MFLFIIFPDILQCTIAKKGGETFARYSCGKWNSRLVDQAEKAQKPYYLMDVMQFLLPYVKVHQPTDISGNLPSLGQTSEEAKEDSVQEIEDEH